MFKLGIIGLGNMGTAILDGALKGEFLEKDDLILFDHNIEKLEKYKKLGIKISKDEEDLVENSQNILVAVKPQSFKALATNIKEKIPKSSSLISIAAGISLEKLDDYFSCPNTIRVMPNTPALVNEGMSCICVNDTIEKEKLDFAKGLFSAVGDIAEIPEDKLDAFSGVAGCMPAFVFMFIEAAADAAVKNGLKRKDAYKYISKTLLGSAKMLLETGDHPGQLKDAVTSPGGTTIKGVLALEEAGFRNAIIKAVDASSNAKVKL